jgi:hypothetical protein
MLYVWVGRSQCTTGPGVRSTDAEPCQDPQQGGERQHEPEQQPDHLDASCQSGPMP